MTTKVPLGLIYEELNQRLNRMHQVVGPNYDVAFVARCKNRDIKADILIGNLSFEQVEEVVDELKDEHIIRN